MSPDDEWPGPPPTAAVAIETMRLVLLADQDLEWYRAQIVGASHVRLPGESDETYDERHDRHHDYGRVYEWLRDRAESPEQWRSALKQAGLTL